MTATESTPDPDSGLAALGLDGPARAAYRMALQRPGLAVGDLARALGTDPAKLAAVLVELHQLSLISRAPGPDGGVYATEPADCLATLVREKQAGLDAAGRVIPGLQAIYADSLLTEDANAFVEVITDRDAVIRRITQLQSAVQQQVLVFDKPPYVVEGTEVIQAEHDQLTRGVEVRVVYETTVLDDPRYAHSLRDMVKRGEQARVVDELPAKLMLIDRRLAVAPLGTGRHGRNGIAVITAVPLLDMLHVLFESLWRSAIPLTPAGVAGAAATAGLSSEQENLLALAISGMKDDALARQLAVSRRTVQRRLHDLMRALGCTSRAQLPIRAAELGLLPQR